MNHNQARQLASDTVTWCFKNDIDTSRNVAQISKESKLDPKFSDGMWARLMTEAIVSFHKGLELEPSGHRANSDKNSLNDTIDLVGSKAFHNIAFIVSAAGARRPIEQEIEQSFVEAPINQGAGEAFTGIEGLTSLISTSEDANAYGAVSTIFVQMQTTPVSQGIYHQSAQQIQEISKTPGLSQPFAKAIASLGAEYMQLADELTRQSGDGQQQGADVGTSGLPTGVQVQGFHRKVVQACRRIVQESLDG